MSKPQKKGRINFRQRLIDRLNKIDDLSGHIVTFVFADNTSKQIEIKPAFLLNRKGRVKTNREILGDLDALKWDEGAKYYTL